MRRLISLPFALSLAFLIGRAGGQNNGSIKGTVINEHGDTVKGARAYAVPVGEPMLGKVPQSETDETGHFTIAHLRWGQYSLSASKEEEDYPDLSTAFYAGFGAKLLTVTLESSHPSETATIRLGPKAGVLVGTVRDAVTGNAVNPCAEFRRVSEPNNFLMGTGLINAKYRVLIPSNVDVTLKVWLAGYKPWYYPSTNGSETSPLRLRPAEEKKLEIQLYPDPTARDAGCGMPVGTIIKP